MHAFEGVDPGVRLNFARDGRELSGMVCVCVAILGSVACDERLVLGISFC
jgi:hypothetical protein